MWGKNEWLLFKNNVIKHLIFKGVHLSYHWLCSVSWCDAHWRPWWCRSGKRRALMERSRWSSSSWCTPNIDREPSNENRRDCKRKLRHLSKYLHGHDGLSQSSCSKKHGISYISVFVAWVGLLMWPETNIFKIEGNFYNILNSYFFRLSHLLFLCSLSEH